VYVPAGGNIYDTINQLTNEKGTASNIKSKTTRKNVLTALEKIISHLRLFKQTPENGLVVFCGNISQVEGKEDIHIWSFEPPVKMQQKLYWCDQQFVLDPLREIVSEKEIYGLIVLDAKEASIGFLKGKLIEQTKKMESTVPSKSIKGGMCLSPNTLVQLADGRIVKINELTEEMNPLISVNFSKFRSEPCLHKDIFTSNVSTGLRIITKYPGLEITTSKNHRFFVLTTDGVGWKFAKDLNKNDFLLTVRNVRVNNGNDVKLEFKQNRGKIIRFPRKLNAELCEFLGYSLGDGSSEKSRITLYDQDKSLLNLYQQKVKKLFKLNSLLKARKNKGYYELKIDSTNLVSNIRRNFPGILGNEKYISNDFCKARKPLLAGFVRGLFDAEGYIDRKSGEVGIGMVNESVIRYLQIILLRFGIISSYRKEDRKHKIEIGDFVSLENFAKFINFNSKAKRNKLMSILKPRKIQIKIPRIPIAGTQLLKLAKEVGLSTVDFPTTHNFFSDSERKTFESFKKIILVKFKKRLKVLKTMKFDDLRTARKILKTSIKQMSKTLGCSTYMVYAIESGLKENKQIEKEMIIYLRKQRMLLLLKCARTLILLQNFATGDLILTRVNKIKFFKNKTPFYDLTVPSFENFIANGLVVHNSQMRYDRMREDALNEFFTKVADSANEIFLKEKNLKGIIIAGPGPQKENFFRNKYLNYQLQNKVLGVKDVGYTGEEGLEELVERSLDLLEQAAVVKERELMAKLFSELKTGGNVVYGLDEVKKALDASAVEQLLVSEEFNYVHVKLNCQNNHEEEKDLPRYLVAQQKCVECGQQMNVVEEREIVDDLIEQAVKDGATVEYISVNTPEGRQFREIGGIAAFLRYKLS